MAYKPNVGGLDLVYFDTEILSDPWTRGIFGFLGTVFLLTAVFRYCPFYLVIGFNSARTEPGTD